jgi:RNA polymerase sigma-54 factor
MRQSKDQEARKYITDRLNAAQALIKSIEQRKQTIVRVTESIVRYQEDFFERGPEHLRPLVLRTIADELGLHESTVSRVTSNKYVQTPRGLYDLKFFFNSMIQGTGAQEDLASEAVKTKIRHMISQEDPKHPLSDQRIAELLADDGLQIARRTVAKYRESIHILSSAQRRRHF